MLTCMFVLDSWNLNQHIRHRDNINISCHFHMIINGLGDVLILIFHIPEIQKQFYIWIEGTMLGY